MFFIFRHYSGSLDAEVAGLPATRLSAQVSDETAAFMDILSVEECPAGSDELAEFSSQQTSPDIFEVVECELPHFLKRLLQTFSLLLL